LVVVVAVHCLAYRNQKPHATVKKLLSEVLAASHFKILEVSIISSMTHSSSQALTQHFLRH
jgi:hypothetical protein